MKKNGIQCTTQYKFLNSIVHCIDFVVLCCLVGPLLYILLMSFISKKDCRVGEFTDMKETILMNNNNWNSKFWENTGNFYLSVFSQYRPILSLPENGGKQCPKQIYKFKFDLDFLFFCVKGCVKGKCDYWNFDKILPFSLP